MSENLPDKLPESEILFYQTEDGKSRIKVRLEGETVWLSQKAMAELYQIGVNTINYHIKEIYEDQEVDADSTIRNYRIVQTEGARQVTRNVEFYNLDVILAVGYRVRGHRGSQFRRWASELLSEYLVKGFTMDDQRLKEGWNIGADYFDELLERIRDIRASEKRFYQKIRDIYSLSIDYEPRAEETKEFFQIVQNKLHWAISGKTAAELIAERADSSKPNMGLTSWKSTKVRKADIAVAKNYLKKDELDQLNRIVTMYLDYAEMQAQRQKPLYMKDWREKLDAFLKFNEQDILKDAGRISKEVADKLALEEYEKFNQRRLTEEAAQVDPDFDQTAKQIESKIKDNGKKYKVK